MSITRSQRKQLESHPHWARVAGAGLLALVVASCEHVTDSRLHVLRTRPADGARDVPKTAAIEVDFSYRVNIESVGPDSFLIEGIGAGQIPGSFSYSDPTRTVTFRPDDGFPPGDRVTVSVTSRVRSTAGVSADPVVFSFSIEPAPPPEDDPPEDPPGGDPPDDPPAPSEEITARLVEPSLFGTSVPRDSDIVVEFSSAVDPLSVTEDAVIVEGELSGRIPVSLDGTISTGQALRATPERPFAPGERVCVTLTRGITAPPDQHFSGARFSFWAAAGPPPHPRQRIEPPIGPGGTTTATGLGDLDGDGRPEVLHARAGDGTIRVFRTTGVAGFELGLELDAVEPPTCIELADTDGDGDLDLLAGGSDRVRVFRNVTGEPGVSPGLLVLEEAPGVATSSPVTAIAVGDVDHNGAAETLVGLAGRIELYPDTLGGLPAFWIRTDGQPRGGVALADLDADGHEDIVYTEEAPPRLSWRMVTLDAEGNIEVSAAASIELPAQAKALVVRDFSSDGSPDIGLLLDEAAQIPPLVILLQATGGTFTEWPPPSGLRDLGGIAAFATGDLTGDGALDAVAVARTTGVIYTLLGDPNGGFAQAEETAVLAGPSAVRLADLGGDGVLDALVAARDGMHVFFSDVPPPPPPPPDPPVIRYSMDAVTVTQGDSDASTIVRLTNTVAVDALSLAVLYDPSVLTDLRAERSSTLTEAAEFAVFQTYAGEAAFTYAAIMELVPPFEGLRIDPGEAQPIVRVLFDVPEDAPVGISTLVFADSAGTPPIANEVTREDETLLAEVVSTAIEVLGRPPPPPPNPNRLSVGTGSAPPGRHVSLPVRYTTELSLEGYTVVGTYDTTGLRAAAIVTSGSATGNIEPEFFAPNIVPDEGRFAVAAIFDFVPPLENRRLEPATDGNLFAIDLEVHQDAVIGRAHAVELRNGLGNPPLDNMFSAEGLSYFPELASGAVLVAEESRTTFVRGDANADGAVNDEDATFILEWLLRSGPEPLCMDAADADDSGEIDIADALRILAFTFYDPSLPPAPPYPEAGVDPTADELECSSYPPA